MKMNGMVGIVSCLLLIASHDTLATTSCPFDGFYTGASLGTSLFTGRVNNTRAYDQVLYVNAGDFSFVDYSNYTISMNRRIKKNSPYGALYAGYGYSFCEPFYIAAEGYLNSSKKRSTFREESTFASFNSGDISGYFENFFQRTSVRSRHWEYGLDLRPGFIIACNTLLYGRIGFSLNKLTIRNSIGYHNNDIFLLGDFNVLFSKAIRKKRASLRAGLGVEHNIFSCLSLRADYIYTKYRRLRSITRNTSILNLPESDFFPPRAIVSTLSDNMITKLQNHAVMLGLSYYWQ